MSKWLLVALLGFDVHFAASYLVPLDAPSQREFGGLLRWFWPWAYGDGGPLGQITPAAGFPIAGFFLAVTAGGVLLLAALAAAGIWVPTAWWPVLAAAGAVEPGRRQHHSVQALAGLSPAWHYPRNTPSRISMRRGATAATSGSWVTRTTVRPSAFSARTRSSTRALSALRSSPALQHVAEGELEGLYEH